MGRYRILTVGIVSLFVLIVSQPGFAQGGIEIDPVTGLPIGAPKGGVSTTPALQSAPQPPSLKPYPKPPTLKPTKKGHLTLKSGKVVRANVVSVSGYWVLLENLDTKKHEQYPLFYFHGSELERDTKKLDDYLALEGAKPSRSDFVFGVALFHGLRGTERNVGLAIQQFAKASKAGDLTACAWLQWIYQSGDGVDANLQHAAAWKNYAANIQRARLAGEQAAVVARKKQNVAQEQARKAQRLAAARRAAEFEQAKRNLQQMVSQAIQDAGKTIPVVCNFVSDANSMYKNNRAAYDAKYHGKRFSFKLKESDLSVHKESDGWNVQVIGRDETDFGGIKVTTHQALYFSFPASAVDQLAGVKRSGSRFFTLSGEVYKLTTPDQNVGKGTSGGISRVFLKDCAIR